jgi:hypothetical protein
MAAMTMPVRSVRVRAGIVETHSILTKTALLLLIEVAAARARTPAPTLALRW